MRCSQSDVRFIHRHQPTASHYEKNRIVMRKRRVTHILINRHTRRVTFDAATKPAHAHADRVTEAADQNDLTRRDPLLSKRDDFIHSNERVHLKTAIRCRLTQESHPPAAYLQTKKLNPR